MAKPELTVVVLWHMHQPDYIDGKSGDSVLPWVRLHALTSYYDTLQTVREVPEARAVFNLAPILIRQLELQASGRTADLFMDLARTSPSDLSSAERMLLLQRFFAFNHRRRFAEMPRLGELWHQREALGGELSAQDGGRFQDRELRDLQVGFLLAWTGQTLRQHALVRALLTKGYDFTEAEKHQLLDLQQEFLGGIIPVYRAAAREGSIEISCTPFTHPILPLLCDGRSAREARPDLALPATNFRYPGDAWCQVRQGLDETERLIGIRPTGMWPAEGSLSEEAIRVFAVENINWLASDQEVLIESWDGDLPPGKQYQAFRLPEAGSPALFFRDRELSDRIGFVYGNWPVAEAVADFVKRLQTIRESLPPGQFVVPVILDGENPWESYIDHGIPFLRALYRDVAAADGLRWGTFREYLLRMDETLAVPLPRLKAGSWIRHDFTTWIGDRETNAGWDLLQQTREWLQPHLERAGVLVPVRLPGRDEPLDAPDPVVLSPESDTDLARAWTAMASAEGSDWFWWYGDEHHTDFAGEFDTLFRTHLSNVYRFLGEHPDPRLQISLLSGPPRERGWPPRFPLEVELDGRVSNYYEWLDAGVCEVTGGQAMHRVDVGVQRLYYGGNVAVLWLRLDPVAERQWSELAGCTVTLRRCDRPAVTVQLRFPPAPGVSGQLEPVIPPGQQATTARGVYDRIVEIAIPWVDLELAAGQQCTFIVTVSHGADPELVIPTAGTLALRVPSGPTDAEDWLV
ncbi:MAG: glycoside hydrolase family 57 protein [bacterium]